MPSKESIEIRKKIVRDKLREDVPLQKQRKEWEEYALSLPLPDGIEFEEEPIGDVPCLGVRREQSCDEHVIVYIHGGGLVEGSPLTHREFAARLTKITQYSVLLVDYRLAPEHPYPAGLHDVQSVYRDLLNHRFHAKQIFVGGDSSGGGLALSAVIQLRDESVNLPAAVFAISAVFDCALTGESMTTRANIDPFTSKEVLAHCCKLYAQGKDLRSPLISPLYADLSGLPPLLIQVGDHEILLSDSLRLAEKIKQCEGVVSLKVWGSMWHTWPLYPDLPEAQEAIEEIRDFLHQR